MVNWEKLCTELQEAAPAHKKLESVFAQFAEQVEFQVNESGGIFKDIDCAKDLDKGFFTLTFAQRTVTYVFTSFADADGHMVGKVSCYLKSEFPEPVQKFVGEFTFSTRGKTDQTEERSRDVIYIDSDSNWGCFAIALHFLNESLAFQEAPH